MEEIQAVFFLHFSKTLNLRFIYSVTITVLTMLLNLRYLSRDVLEVY